MSSEPIAIAYHWKPIEQVTNPGRLSIPRLRSFAELWQSQRVRLQASGALEAFSERLRRLWAIETGIIERLYDLSEGATRLLVEQGFHAGLVAHGEATIEPDDLLAILGDHRESLDFAMDVIGGSRPLSVGWIKELHSLLTRHQQTARAMDQFGRYVDIKLQRGEFKSRPNNPISNEEGGVHEYCPPVHVESEMERLVAVYHSMPNNCPEVRAAWLHHSFTQIHPFQDGNGRVARVLASIDFIRAGLFPLLVQRDQKQEYLDALREADRGNLSRLVRFFARTQERMLIRALSEAERSVSAKQGLDSVLAAAQAKRQRRLDDTESNRAFMAERLRVLIKRASQVLRQRAQDIRQQVAGVQANVVPSKTNTHHWYRTQLIELGRSNDYWADLNEPRRWTRLELRDGGKTEIVIALHFIGNPSPGAAVAVAFVVHRAGKERVGDQPPFETAAEPLLLTVKDNLLEQEHSFDNWLDSALVQALAVWTRFL